MARLRVIKSESWSDKALPSVSREAHLTWIGTWNFADDDGVLEANALWVKSQVYPLRTDVTLEEVEEELRQLEEARFLIRFIYNRTHYYLIRTFKKHQVISHPSKTRFIPKEQLQIVLDQIAAQEERSIALTNTTGVPLEPSIIPPPIKEEHSSQLGGGLRPGWEGMGGDGRGRESGKYVFIHPTIHTPSEAEKKREEPLNGSPKKESPIAQPPLQPLKNEFANKLPDDTLLRTVEECADIYMNHSMYEKSRNDLMKITFDTSIPGYEDYDDWTSKLREWNAAYSEWLIFTRGDTLKTLRDYVMHIRQKLPDHVRRGNYDPKKGFDRRRAQRSKAEIKIPWNTPEFIEWWRLWKEYLSEQFAGLEYSVSAEQAALTRLTHCSGGVESVAIEVIKNAMSAASRYLNPIHKTNGKQSSTKEPTLGGIPKSKLQDLHNMEVKVQRRS